MKKIILSVLTVTALITSANADCIASGCNQINISKLYILFNGDVHITTTGTETNLNCRDTSSIRLPHTHKGQKTIYSALLTAQTTKKKVGLQIVEGSAKCDIAYISY